MTAAAAWLCDRDWSTVADSYHRSAPYNYAVLDAFLLPAVAERLRQQLLNHWAWHYKSPYSHELYLKQPDLPEVQQIAQAVADRLPSLFNTVKFVEHWAFLHHENCGLVAHSDVGAISIDIWLTPDEYNIAPGTGGLVMHDVKRPDSLSVFEFQTRAWTQEYLDRHTTGTVRRIPYSYNRAVIFDARTIHASDAIDFSGQSSATQRMNFSMLFDDPDRYASRPRRYAERFASMERLAAQEDIDLNSAELTVAERLWERAG
jgi:hypothetical protein